MCAGRACRLLDSRRRSSGTRAFGVGGGGTPGAERGPGSPRGGRDVAIKIIPASPAAAVGPHHPRRAARARQRHCVDAA